MHNKKKRDTKKTIGYGFVGRWREGELGWCVPSFVGPGKGNTSLPDIHDWNDGEPVYFCRITIRQVFDKRGRPIVRYLHQRTRQ